VKTSVDIGEWCWWGCWFSVVEAVLITLTKLRRPG